MWQSRRWRFLLNVIDHLPRTSYFSQAVANDEEHALMILQAQEAGMMPGRPGPSLTHWSPEAERLDSILDGIRALIVATANGAGAHLPPPKPVARPTTALDRVRHRQRMLKHEALVARVKAAQAEVAAAQEASTVE